MKKVIIMKGLPGSGKSTFAKKMVSENPNMYKRINRDDLRMMFDNGTLSEGNEKFIKKVRDLLIIKALEEGKHVIVDDTNLADTNHLRIKQLVQEFNKTHNDQVLVEIKEMDTSMEECIARDASREKPVGEKVIRQMSRIAHKDPLYTLQDAALPKAILCDLDGTLALLNGRNPFDASTCDKDLPNTPIVSLVKNYAKLEYKILLMSGRQDCHRSKTTYWLEAQNIEYEMLLMRKTNDMRKDSLVKKELFESYIQGKYYVEFILDDRNQVVDMWRNELRLPCLQVYYGNF
ncbi:MAG TPA: AAA family ATPase [Cytophagales bacterium]|nr:AAA family ATPase [Cytophagales bacterium]